MKAAMRRGSFEIRPFNLFSARACSPGFCITSEPGDTTTRSEAGEVYARDRFWTPEMCDKPLSLLEKVCVSEANLFFIL
jgi:hypothetical protein